MLGWYGGGARGYEAVGSGALEDRGGGANSNVSECAVDWHQLDCRRSPDLPVPGLSETETKAGLAYQALRQLQAK